MASDIWNPWHGCKKISPGCHHCYVYRRDAEFGKNSSIVTKTRAFTLPIQRNKKREYKLNPESGLVYTCMTSDFFIEQADEWRRKAWEYIKERSDLHFIIITKRIHRFKVSLPEDWQDGYGNVSIWSTCENQSTADRRLPLLLENPIKHRAVIHEPMLGKINIEKYLKTGLIERVVCGGESGGDARICDYAWVLDTMMQCVRYDVEFHFKQTGANFKRGGKIYRIDRKNQMEQAAKAGIDYIPD